MQKHAPKYGYMKDADGLTVPNPTECYILKVMYSLHRLGISTTRIANQLNLLGYTNRNGMPWHRQGVNQLMKRNRQTILYVPGDAEQEAKEREANNYFRGVPFRYEPLVFRN
ncbi:MAG: hypothetical protein IPG59_00935 [Candidatus Melainabacteria bacterium]|nr:MAG: hypothetical protein IPG59_00935 [Candidatus Melainabacteria bacterium]